MSSFEICESFLVEQSIDGNHRALFLKERIACSVAGGRIELVRKRASPAASTRGAALLIHGFGQNRYSWHLSERSFANYLAEQGFDVFNLELRGHGRSRLAGSPYPDSFEHYVEDDVPAALQAVCELSGHEKAFLVGHSLGGAISYAVAPLVAERLAGVITIAGVFLFGGQAVLRRSAKAYTALAALADPFLRVLPYVPVDLAGRILTFLSPILDHPAAQEWPLSIWYPGSMEPKLLRERMSVGMDRTGAQVLRQMIDWAATGRFLSRRRQSDYAQAFAQLDLPLLVVSGDRDMLCTPEDCYPAYLLSESRDKTYRKFGERDGGHWGHLDLISGRRAPLHTWPYLADWLRRRASDGPKKQAANSKVKK